MINRVTDNGCFAHYLSLDKQVIKNKSLSYEEDPNGK